MTEDKFQILKSKYLDSIKSREREIAEFKEKIRLLQELEAEADAVPTNGAESGNGKYSGRKLTAAISDALETIASDQWVTSGAIGKYLLSQGFKPKGKNYAISVGLTLKRLAKTKRVQTKSEDGSRLYMGLK